MVIANGKWTTVTIHCWCSSICHGTKEKVSDAIVILPSRSLSANEMRRVEDGGLGESMGHSHTGVTQQRDPDLEGKVGPGLPSWKGWLFRGRRVSSFNFNLLASWKESYDQPRQHIKKQRHHFANKGPHSQSYGFSSSHEQMCELDQKEGWVLKNWYFRTVVLEKTLESIGLQGDQNSQS